MFTIGEAAISRSRTDTLFCERFRRSVCHRQEQRQEKHPMYVMQYEIGLPADYDMGIIRHRVATRRAALDNFSGLGLKAYCIRERAVDGSTVNQYAPFYLWSDIDAMGRFLWGGAGFGGIIESFGLPIVHHCTGVAFQPGPASSSSPQAAARRVEAIPIEGDPATTVAQALGEFEHRVSTPGVHSTALAVDPRHWQLVHFTLWEDAAPDGPDTRYQVLHMSNPSMNDLGGSKTSTWSGR
jgi:Domain of unknown function (DUF4865)